MITLLCLKAKKIKSPPKWIWFKIADYEYKLYTFPISALDELCLTGNILVVKKILYDESSPSTTIPYIYQHAMIALFTQNLNIFRILTESIIDINKISVLLYSHAISTLSNIKLKNLPVRSIVYLLESEFKYKNILLIPVCYQNNLELAKKIIENHHIKKLPKKITIHVLHKKSYFELADYLIFKGLL